MSTHGIQRDPCCVFPADAKTVTKISLNSNRWRTASMPLSPRRSTR